MKAIDSMHRQIARISTRLAVPPSGQCSRGPTRTGAMSTRLLLDRRAMNRCTIFVSSCLLAVFSSLANAGPLGTAFTYQGSINYAGNPVDELADMRLSLWTDQVPVGTQIGATIEYSFEPGADAPAIIVADGLFTVDLDFGVTPFDGQDVYLEIEVRLPSGPAGSWTTLSRRHEQRCARGEAACPRRVPYKPQRGRDLHHRTRAKRQPDYFRW